ncbi:Flp family type IVb pilin [Alkalicoccus saliphilus]|uniref:Flp family type IVb pilin n=1 Tax=Alkalicoccus saliphilus TaxID=200989 RepID=A0A2T4U6V9_9BACI|nr:Flp family type IVb pilin [Alkalicoccus saliphilus]PTL39143.1 Flp family type IVb pilin [Alkalicoccus saliphilus]
MMEMFKNLLVEEEGQGMAEYALILAGVAIAVIVALIALGEEITNFIQDDIMGNFGDGEV